MMSRTNVIAETQEQEETGHEIVRLRQIIAEYVEQLNVLRSQVVFHTNQEKELRQMLYDAHEQLLKRDEQIQELLVTILHQNHEQQPAPAAPAAPPSSSVAEVAHQQPQAGPAIPHPPPTGAGHIPGKHLHYQHLIQRIRSVVCATLPANTTIIVVSKGDDELLRLPGQRAWHFPQNNDGVYAGYYPETSFAAITHLEQLRNCGGDYLLFPHTAFWWREHYPEFWHHLESRYRTVINEEQTCIVFLLRDKSGVQQQRNQPGNQDQEQPVARILPTAPRPSAPSVSRAVPAAVAACQATLEHTVPSNAIVLVMHGHKNNLLQLEHGQLWPFPQDATGRYTTYYPPDSAAAIAHLDALRERGAGFLYIPRHSFWWLDYYKGFRQHLETHGHCLYHNDECRLYQLDDLNHMYQKKKDVLAP
jgi:hypothetical protein